MKKPLRQYELIFLIIVFSLVAILPIFFVANTLTRISAGLPLDLIAIERDVSVYLSDIQRLEYALRSHSAVQTSQSLQDLKEALDLAALRNIDMAGLGERTQSHVFAEVNRELTALIDRLDALFTGPGEQLVAELPQITQSTTSIALRVKEEYDSISQHSIAALSREAHALSALIDSVIIILACMVVALFLIGGLGLRLYRAQTQLVASQNELRARLIELEAAKFDAEKASKTKSDFLANMSHELRTPLNAVIGFGEVMHERVLGPIPDQYREYAGLIVKSGRHLLQIINQILDLAKIEAGKMELEEETVSPTELAREVLDLLRLVAERKGLALTDDMETLPVIVGDAVRIKQALFNVIGNAVKFTEPGGAVSVSTGVSEGVPILTVTDTGPGMDESVLAVALEPFGRAMDQALVRRSEGTGLGLSLTRQIMELHGGGIRIHSVEGMGTTVDLLFPQAASAAAE